MDKQKVIENAKDFIKNKFKDESSDHDWRHPFRVHRLALAFAKDEGGDTFIIELAALLHEVADWRLNGGDERIGVKAVREWLKGQGLDEGTTEHVCETIQNMGFKGTGKTRPKTLEGTIVYEADLLDATGAIGLARVFTFGGKHGRSIYDPDVPINEFKSAEDYKKSESPSIQHIYEKLLEIESGITLPSAKQLARKKQERMQQFLDDFHEESGVGGSGIKYFSGKNPCPSNCLYCFARLPGYRKFEPFTIQRFSYCIDTGYNTIYPNCDKEFFDDTKQAVAALTAMKDRIKAIRGIDIPSSLFNSSCDEGTEIFSKKPVAISISTKSKNLRENEEVIKYISELNKELNGLGFIKVSVTFTNESKVNEIEPKTDTYEGRIRTLELLHKHNVPTCAIIKPILPFISIDEYMKIINDASKYTNLFLLGELYVNKYTAFYEKYIQGNYTIEPKNVQWMNGLRMYSVKESRELYEKLMKRTNGKQINGRTIYCYDSDDGILEHIRGRLPKYISKNIKHNDTILDR